ncbi:MAG: arabinogalactan oligomer/maltooligosaccharide transport system permease protein [Myxococcota bacterium]|jgi:arabinogalactan oligomer/maltooligosaccharide transport system permease protein
MSPIRRIWGQIWPHLVLVLASIFALYPVLWVVKTALSPGNTLSPDPNPFPSEVTLVHLEKLVEAPYFGIQLWNSIIVALATTVVGLGLSTTAAYAFSRFRFAGRQQALAAFMLTQIVPGVVMMIPLFILLDAIGLRDSLLGLVLVYATTAIPFCTWMLKGYFDTIPKELEEAALIDGASRWVLFTKVVLPLSRPALAVTALFSFMTAWNEFILAATFMNAESGYTLPVALQRYVGAFSTDWGTFAAGAILTSIPVMALFFLLQKHLVGGLTAGGVKG